MNLERFKSRKLWIALIGQITGIAVLMFGPDHAETVENVAQNLGSLFLIAATGAGYIRSQGKVDAAKQYNQPVEPILPMKRPPNSQRAPLIITLMMLSLFAGGCAKNAEARWYQQRVALTSANEVFIAFAPHMTDSQVIKYGELLQDARTALDAAKILLPEGGATFDDHLRIVESILMLMAEKRIQDEARGNPSSDTDRPSDPPISDATISPARSGWQAHRRTEAVDHGRSIPIRLAGRRSFTASQRQHRIQWLMAA